MKIKITSKKLNPLLKRKEIMFELDHAEEGQTPSRMELRKELASILKAKLDLVFIEKVETKTGTAIAIGEANTYESAEQAKLVERDHIIARNAVTETAATEEKQEMKEPASKEQAKEPASKEQAKEPASKEQAIEALKNSTVEGEAEATGLEREQEKEK